MSYVFCTALHKNTQSSVKRGWEPLYQRTSARNRETGRRRNQGTGHDMDRHMKSGYGGPESSRQNHKQIKIHITSSTIKHVFSFKSQKKSEEKLLNSSDITIQKLWFHPVFTEALETLNTSSSTSEAWNISVFTWVTVLLDVWYWFINSQLKHKQHHDTYPVLFFHPFLQWCGLTPFTGKFGTV